ALLRRVTRACEGALVDDVVGWRLGADQTDGEAGEGGGAGFRAGEGAGLQPLAGAGGAGGHVFDLQVEATDGSDLKAFQPQMRSPWPDPSRALSAHVAHVLHMRRDDERRRAG